MVLKLANFVVHTLPRNCLLEHVCEGKIEGRRRVKERRKIKSKQLLNDHEKMRGCWKLKGEAVDRNMWRIRFGSICGSVVRKSME